MLENTEQEWVSRTQRKKQCAKINEFAKYLTKLAPGQIRQLDLPENIEEELQKAIRIKSSSAKSRQIKFVGKLIRNHEKSEELTEQFLKKS